MIKNTTEKLLVDQSIRIEAPQEAVFELLTDPTQVERWQPMEFFEPRMGGKFRFAKGEWIAVGEIIEFDRPNAVAYTWDWQNNPIGSRTVVKYELTKDGDGTMVRLTHTGFVDAEWATDHAKGWGQYLGRLKIAAEGGDPGPDSVGS
jgi:uncharacterized protein YndB with AHSA1/START domain